MADIETPPSPSRHSPKLLKKASLRKMSSKKLETKSSFHLSSRGSSRVLKGLTKEKENATLESLFALLQNREQVTLIRCFREILVQFGYIENALKVRYEDITTLTQDKIAFNSFIVSLFDPSDSAEDAHALIQRVHNKVESIINGAWISALSKEDTSIGKIEDKEERRARVHAEIEKNWQEANLQRLNSLVLAKQKEEEERKLWIAERKKKKMDEICRRKQESEEKKAEREKLDASRKEKICQMENEAEKRRISVELERLKAIKKQEEGKKLKIELSRKQRQEKFLEAKRCAREKQKKHQEVQKKRNDAICQREIERNKKEQARLSAIKSSETPNAHILS